VFLHWVFYLRESFALFAVALCALCGLNIFWTQSMQRSRKVRKEATSPDASIKSDAHKKSFSSIGKKAPPLEKGKYFGNGVSSKLLRKKNCVPTNQYETLSL